MKSFAKSNGRLAFLPLLFFLIIAIAPSMRAEIKAGKAELIIVFILDGLRPDCINQQDTPTLYFLRENGVEFTNSHSVFPTVTRVNSAALATGAYPGSNGIVSNSMYIPAIQPNRSFSTGDYLNLIKLDQISGGRLLFTPTLSDRLYQQGLKYVVISSGSSGSAYLLNPQAAQGAGVLINGYFKPDSLVAFPAKVNEDILSRFGPAPPKRGSKQSNNACVDWTEKVLMEYVLPELKPDVIYNWLTEPDHIQHSTGVGSPQSVEAIGNDDRNIGLILEKLKSLGLYEKTDIFVVSDHGFSLVNYRVNVAQELIGAGLKSAPESDDVVIASSGQSVLLHIKNHDAERIENIVRYLQKQQWCGVVFTSGRKNRIPKEREAADFHQGWVAGTFSLELIHEHNRERGPDILLTFPWSSKKNVFGYAGTDYSSTGGKTGPASGNGSGHGSMSPWVVRNTMLAWGVDFKQGATVRTPSSNVDVAPTILALKGIKTKNRMDGRVLAEALQGGPDEEKVSATTILYSTETKDSQYKAIIQVTQTDNQRYIDKSWRIQ